VLRLFVAFNLFLLNLYACQGGYQACVAKVHDSKSIQNNTIFLPLQNKRLLIYTQKIPKFKILKYDPFLSLYLVEDKKVFAYPFDINMHLQLGTAALNATKAKEGRFLVHQIGLNHFAKYSEHLGAAFIITNSCCSLEGLNTSKGVIDKAYLKHFITNKSNEYGDIGVRVIDKKHLVIVNAADPFMKDNPFQKDDCIIMFDGKKVLNAASLMQKILFSKRNSYHKVKVKRSNKFLTFRVKTKKRYGGGYLSDTFLEQKGLYFDNKMQITKCSKEFLNHGLKNGDKLLQVNGVNIINQAQLRDYLQKKKDYSTMLFERNNFQFFVKIK
jgi:hypothetical protein